MPAATAAIFPPAIATSRRARAVLRVDHVPAAEQEVVLRLGHGASGDERQRDDDGERAVGGVMAQALPEAWRFAEKRASRYSPRLTSPDELVLAPPALARPGWRRLRRRFARHKWHFGQRRLCGLTDTAGSTATGDAGIDAASPAAARRRRASRRCASAGFDEFTAAARPVVACCTARPSTPPARHQLETAQTDASSDRPRRSRGRSLPPIAVVFSPWPPKPLRSHSPGETSPICGIRCTVLPSIPVQTYSAVTPGSCG